ncbi:N-acetylglucosaminyldiphosphoundecaprenol N-acetyl-beta-D-mannosaminyltransferase [Desulfitispora alkaliphila]|uniref:WecB/TagA/CpsF family glycosyltransferase n=1 Tax=Desulfitispora alkaliphila TaxID=622674 RepID=UPI003D1B041A
MKVNILGAPVDRVDMEGALHFVEKAITENKPKHIITLNAEIIYQAQSETELMEIINQADLVTPDGAGVVWASKELGNPVPERVTGIDLLQEIAKKANATGWRLFFFGAAPGVAAEAAEKLKESYSNINIVGTHHGFIKTQADEDQLLQQISEAKPHILLVALGAPRQEYWIKKHKEKLGIPVNIGVGGSFDVISGRIDRAPKWMQKVQLEWLYRLIKEPTRFKRMLALPKFMGLVKKSTKKS